MVNFAAFASISMALAFSAGFAVLQFQKVQQSSEMNASGGSTMVRRTNTARQDFEAVQALLEQGDHESAESYLYVLENDKKNELTTTIRQQQEAVVVTDDHDAQELLQSVPSKEADSVEEPKETAEVPQQQQQQEPEPEKPSSSSLVEQKGVAATTAIQEDPFLRNTDYVNHYNLTGRKSIEKLCFDFFGGKQCSVMYSDPAMTPLEAAATLPPTRVSLQFNCQEMFLRSELGSGNYISAFYGLRLGAAAMGHVDLSITCDDAVETRQDLILPWMMGWFPRTVHALPPQNRTSPSIGAACARYRYIQIGWQFEHMRYELRRMAVAMLGIPYAGHPAEQWAEENLWSGKPRDSGVVHQLPTPQRNDKPIYENVDLDEAVLHFRCGDLVSSNHPSFGFMKFGSFSRHLPPDVKTIGIATQPFDEDGQTRRADGGSGNKARCRKVVYAFVDHLQAAFPQARITIRNDKAETIALTFARMVMAQHVVIAITSFGVFPGIATFGRGYVRNPDYRKAPNRWLLKPLIENLVDNVQVITEPKLMAAYCKNSWPADDGERVLEWFQNYTLPESYVKQKKPVL